MAKIAAINQKGGTGKSAVIKQLATELEANNCSVLIHDLDWYQTTTYRWFLKRQLSKEGSIKAYKSTLSDALSISGEVTLYDTKGYASRDTFHLATHVDLCVVPTGLSLDDLDPSIRMCNELVGLGIPLEKLLFVFPKVGPSIHEFRQAKVYVSRAGYSYVPSPIHDLPSNRSLLDSGLAVTESLYRGQRLEADKFCQGVFDYLGDLVG